jgi:hypothetical protein
VSVLSEIMHRKSLFKCAFNVYTGIYTRFERIGGNKRRQVFPRLLVSSSDLTVFGPVSK